MQTRRHPGWKRWRNKWLRRYIAENGFLCHRCKKTRPLEVHHRVSRVVAPARELDPMNVEAVCVPCHQAALLETRAQEHGPGHEEWRKFLMQRFVTTT